MCRVLGYLGDPVVAEKLLYEPDSSLILQACQPQMLRMFNLGGFGLVAWDEDSYQANIPFVYRSISLPMYDRNLKRLTQKIRAQALLAHIRGVRGDTSVTIGEQNLHPFQFSGAKLAMAHNGDLHHFNRMRYDLVAHLRPEIHQEIRGNTDSEWIYALLLSQLEDPGNYSSFSEIAAALEKTLNILRKVREKNGINTSSSINLFFSDGQSLGALRFVFDFGCFETEAGEVPETAVQYLSLWYTLGQRYGFYDNEWKMTGGFSSPTSAIFSSEPLTRDISTWLEVPEYTLIHASRQRGLINLQQAEIFA